jgi:glycosyltransferase involved in cell wall biosynthesis
MSGETPLVSIVTPTLNMGSFLEESIVSVLDQDYANLEYLVMDGGSTDNTLAILRKYGSRLRYCSSPDRGQADAINRGLAQTRGSICAFLNADDTYLPGAVSAIVRAFAENPSAGVIYGNAWHVAEDGSRIAPYPVEPFNRERLARRCYICQPAAFFRRDVFEACGMLDPRLHFALDYDLWIRIAQRRSMLKIDAFLANSRLHRDAKTVHDTGAAMRETMELLKLHYGYVPFNWIYGYAHHRLTGQPLAQERPRLALGSACSSVALGFACNWRHPMRYVRDLYGTAREGLGWSSP